MSVRDAVDPNAPRPPGRDDPEWARRRASNVRLALLFGGVAALVFVLALWKFRPF